MKHLRISTLLIFTILFGFNLQAQDSNADRKTKRVICKYVQKAKALDNRDKKEAAFEQLVEGLNSSIEEIDRSKFSNQELQEMDQFQSKINKAFAESRNGSHEDLNAFGDYFESESNQASFLFGAAVFLGLALIVFLFTKIAF